MSSMDILLGYMEGGDTIVYLHLVQHGHYDEQHGGRGYNVYIVHLAQAGHLVL